MSSSSSDTVPDFHPVILEKSSVSIALSCDVSVPLSWKKLWTALRQTFSFDILKGSEIFEDLNLKGGSK